MAITLKLDDIKPLLGAVGPDDPKPAGVDATPAPPPPPVVLPPTPAAAGFSAWAADPKNAQKVADGVTPPGTPLLPPPPAPPLGANVPLDSNAAQMASVNPPKPPAPAFLNPPTPSAPPTQAQDMAANPDQYQHPNLVGQGWKKALLFGIPAALQSAGSGLSNMGRGNPTAGMSLINDQIAHDRGVPAANAAQYNSRIIQPLKDAATLADTRSQTAQRTAAANKSDSAADAMTPVPLTKEQAAAINQPTLEGTAMTPRDYNRLVGLAGNNNTSQANNTATNATKVTTNAKTNDTKQSVADAANARAKDIADARNKTMTLLQGMRDSTSRANNENTVSNKGTTGAGGFKVPADVTKRAALASNVLENADAVDGILTKRPDIIGAAGGRYSNVQQMIGSDDPDIQALGVRMHNIALASNGAHGVRAQQAIQKTEDELFGNFKAGPNAIRGALGATRGSMQTFLNDEQNFSTTGNRGGGITAPPASGAPKEGDTKVNSHGDKVKFSGGKWGPA